jgi:hypothetical protein
MGAGCPLGEPGEVLRGGHDGQGGMGGGAQTACPPISWPVRSHTPFHYGSHRRPGRDAS